MAIVKPITHPEFWSKIDIRDPESCWEWKAGRDKKGYARLSFNGKPERGHRVSHILAKGPIPTGLDIAHDCNNPPCCNPNHLEPKTRKQNMEHMVASGRSPKGDKSGPRKYPERYRRGTGLWIAKLTDEKVRQIRAEYATGNYSMNDLAKKYGMTFAPIQALIRRNSWKHVD